MTSDTPELLDRVNRASFLRQLFAGSGVAAAAAVVITQSGCRSTAESVIKGAGDGADAWAEGHPELKGKLKQIVDDVAATTSSSRATAEEIEALTRRLNELAERNETNIDRALQGAGDLGATISRTKSALDRLREIFDLFANSAEDLLNALVYFLRQLALKIGAALAALIAYFLYFLFLQEIRRLINELRRKFWSFNLLGAIL